MRPLGGPRAAMLAALMMQGLMPIASASPEPEPEPEPEPRRIPPPTPYFPPKREPPPLTPEQLKAQAKRDRKTRKLEELNR